MYIIIACTLNDFRPLLNIFNLNKFLPKIQFFKNAEIKISK
jgi:hypothetical protein